MCVQCIGGHILKETDSSSPHKYQTPITPQLGLYVNHPGLYSILSEIVHLFSLKWSPPVFHQILFQVLPFHRVSLTSSHVELTCHWRFQPQAFPFFNTLFHWIIICNINSHSIESVNSSSVCNLWGSLALFPLIPETPLTLGKTNTDVIVLVISQCCVLGHFDFCLRTCPIFSWKKWWILDQRINSLAFNCFLFVCLWGYRNALLNFK